MKEGGMTALVLSLMALASMQDAAWSPVMQIAPRADVQVRLDSGVTHRGAFNRADERSVTIDVGRHEIGLERNRITRVAVNRGTHHRKRNTAIGLLAGMLVGAAISQARCDPQQTYCPEGSPAGALPGMAAGALVGAALPSGDWQVVYRR
jgi:hypothetical protein